MKSRKLVSGIVVTSLALVTGVSFSYDNNSNLREAEVISANPVYRTVKVSTPQQQCWQEAVQVPVKQNTSYTPEIFGSIIGAGVGRLFGSGRGQDVATVAGAVLGGSIGRDQKNKRQQNNSQVVYEQRCKVVDEYHTEEQLQGYDVTYEYDGSIYTARTANDPGSTLTVSVNVVPVE